YFTAISGTWIKIARTVSDYFHCSRKDRGMLLRYLQHTSGYSRAQVTRLVAQWHTTDWLVCRL
ncbi:MAG: hypothetical protein ACOYNF_16110, partial [Rhodoferax sp.]